MKIIFIHTCMSIGDKWEQRALRHENVEYAHLMWAYKFSKLSTISMNAFIFRITALCSKETTNEVISKRNYQESSLYNVCITVISHAIYIENRQLKILLRPVKFMIYCFTPFLGIIYWSFQCGTYIFLRQTNSNVTRNKVVWLSSHRCKISFLSCYRSNCARMCINRSDM